MGTLACEGIHPIVTLSRSRCRQRKTTPAATFLPPMKMVDDVKKNIAKTITLTQKSNPTTTIVHSSFFLVVWWLSIQGILAITTDNNYQA